MSKFITLHIHSEYSLLDGMIRIGDLVKYAVDNGLPGIAVTDHGVMYSAIEFYELAKANNINPLIGCEFYVHNDNIHIHDSSNNPLYHLIIIAKNDKGYKNLISWFEKFLLSGVVLLIVVVKLSDFLKNWFFPSMYYY